MTIDIILEQSYEQFSEKLDQTEVAALEIIVITVLRLFSNILKTADKIINRHSEATVFEKFYHNKNKTQQ